VKYRFLFHELNHTFLAVDISEIGVPDFIIEPGGRRQSVPTIRFKSWSDLEAYFSTLEVKSELVAIREDLKRNGAAVLTVPSRTKLR
jgi:hypothetical protein